jgi:hypothetical protein
MVYYVWQHSLSVAGICRCTLSFFKSNGERDVELFGMSLHISTLNEKEGRLANRLVSLRPKVLSAEHKLNRVRSCSRSICI